MSGGQLIGSLMNLAQTKSDDNKNKWATEYQRKTKQKCHTVQNTSSAEEAYS